MGAHVLALMLPRPRALLAGVDARVGRRAARLEADRLAVDPAHMAAGLRTALASCASKPYSLRSPVEHSPSPA